MRTLLSKFPVRQQASYLQPTAARIVHYGPAHLPYSIHARRFKHWSQHACSSLPRFYVESNDLRGAQKGGLFQLSEAESKHALRVLRMQEGEPVELCDGCGSILEGILGPGSSSKTASVFATASVRKIAWEGPKWEVVAALGSLKGGRAETLVEKICELGAWSLQPLLTARSPAMGRPEGSKMSSRSKSNGALKNDSSTSGRGSRLERVSVAACKQSLRSHSLILKPPCQLEELFGLITAGAPTLVATQGAPPLYPTLSSTSTASYGSPGSKAKVDGRVNCSGEEKPYMLMVGPEGDFTESELSALLAAGAKPVGLGKNRLRVETAAIAILAGAVLHYEAAVPQET